MVNLVLPDLAMPDGLYSLLEILLWIGLAALVVLLGLRIRSLVAKRLRRRPPETAIVGETARATQDPDLPDHGRLAREGRFSEAIHALLLGALVALGRTTALPPARTSREIARDVPLANDARDALSGLVRAVEVSLFGGRESEEREYRESVADLQTIERALGGEKP